MQPLSVEALFFGSKDAFKEPPSIWSLVSQFQALSLSMIDTSLFPNSNKLSQSDHFQIVFGFLAIFFSKGENLVED